MTPIPNEILPYEPSHDRSSSDSLVYRAMEVVPAPASGGGRRAQAFGGWANRFPILQIEPLAAGDMLGGHEYDR